MDNNEIKKLVLELIEEFCDDYDLDFMNDYSGRGMYGKRCIGFVTYDTMGSIVNLCDALRDNEEITSAADALGDICTDNLGRGYIVYFPHLSLDE